MSEKNVSENMAKSVGGKVRLIKEIPGRIVERADQVLLGLSHTKEAVPTLLKQTLQRIEKNPTDLVGRVSRSVLERAEEMRKQLVEKAEGSEAAMRWVPEWLKEASFVRTVGEAAPLASAADLVEASPAKSFKEKKASKSVKQSVKPAKAASKATRAKKSPRTKKV